VPANEATLLLGAQIEFQAIFNRFAEYSFARARDFDRLVHEGMQQLEQFPRSAPLHIGRYHRLRLEDLPYGLFYAIEGQRIFIHAILDIRQPREAIARRLGVRE
jgi:ParE toxin of type II toxin-antitoxin system, parDE